MFAVHFPYLDEISNVPDITNLHVTKGRKLKTATSPIALFVSVKSPETKRYELKPVAIQIDSYRGKPINANLIIHKSICNSHLNFVATIKTIAMKNLWS